MSKKFCPHCHNEVVKSENPEYEWQCLECDEDFYSFEVVNEDETEVEVPKETEIKVVVCRPNEKAELITIPNTLEAKQKLVGGWIEAIYPYEDEVALVCNEEGKINGLDLNRAIYDDECNIIDIVAGTFFICGLTEDDFASLSDELAEKYLKKFLYPEIFYKNRQGEVKAEKIVF